MGGMAAAPCWNCCMLRWACLAVDISTEPGGLSNEGLSILEKILRSQEIGVERRGTMRHTVQKELR